MLTASRTRGSADAGFTLLELVVVMSIAGVLASLGLFGFTSWQRSSEHQGTADAFIGELRNVATRAVSEGRTYCVEVQPGGQQWSLWRYSCGGTPAAGDPTPVEVASGESTHAAHVTLTATVTSVTGTHCDAPSQCLYFFPRGTASEADVTVASSKRVGTTYTIRVEGLTSRVFLV